MRKVRKRLGIVRTIAFLLVLSLVGFSLGTKFSSFAWFSTEEQGAAAESHMATVSIELADPTQATVDASAPDVTFGIVNGSDIKTYMRVGLIFELIDEVGNYSAEDASGLTVGDVSAGWSLVPITDGGYTKNFLIYGSGTEDYTAVDAGANPSGSFSVGNIPPGYSVKISVVPEAVQCDVDNDALTYFKDAGKSGMTYPWKP